MLTNECLQNYVSYFACKTSLLADKYETALSIGSSCTEQLLFQLEVAITLNNILCSITLISITGQPDYIGDGCVDQDQICELIDKLKYILNASCNC